MHFNDDQLRAWLDDELDRRDQSAAAAHLAECPACTHRVTQIRELSGLTRNQLNSLAPEAAIHFSAHEALEKHVNRRKEPIRMKTLFKRPASIAAGLVILITVSLLFPPVQAMASDFLGLFRVQQVKVVSFDPDVLSQMDQNFKGNDQQIRQFFEENIKKVQASEFTQAETSQQAARLAGFTPRLPENSQVGSIGVVSAQKYEIEIDTELWNSILAGLGQEEAAIPTELNGQKITVDVPAGITAGIGECKSLQQVKADMPETAQLGDCILLIEMPSPVVQTPDGLDVPRLAETMLKILGMDPAQARAFSQSTDWATTLVLPIPTGEGVTSQDVSVDGTTATLVTHQTNAEYTLFWVRDGILYALLGSGDSKAALDLSASLPQ